MSRLGPLIAKSAVADLYAWGDAHTLKLYRPGASPDAAAREAAQARIAHGAGIATPGVADVITLDGLTGVVFERVDGPSMLELMGERPEGAVALAHQLADLHADLHSRPGVSMPSQRERLRRRITSAYGLTTEARAAALTRLEARAEGQALCHGDFHPGNIIMAERGPVIVDWYDAASGSPAADLARTVLLLRFAPLPPSLPTQVRHGIDAVRGSFCAAYLQHYTTLRPDTIAEIDSWHLPVAVGRLAELVTRSEQAALVAFIDELLTRP